MPHPTLSLPVAVHRRNTTLMASLLATALACTNFFVSLNSVLLAPAFAQNTNPTENKTWVELSARASEIDPRTKSYPDIDFLLERDNKPTDIGHACVLPPTSKPNSPQKQNKLVIWMMGHSPELFHFLADQGFHVLRVHYANGWFNRFGKDPHPEDPMALGRIRLEAATGEDHSPLVAIDHPDGMQERVRQFLLWLHQHDPESHWNQFLDENSQIRWDQVIMSGASHGATTSARFAIHQRVARVVMFCGPRDQYETWQSLDSATPRERFFGFSHILDSGWSGDHYCRSWELLGLNAFGPIVNADMLPPPYEFSRRIITNANVDGDEKRAHSCVTPGKAAIRNTDGSYSHDPVWKYLFTHPTELIGSPSATDPDCTNNHLPKP